jgi:hypothetical protein
MTAAPSIPQTIEPVIEHVEDTPGDEVATVVATVDFLGKRFTVREQGVSLLALMKFAVVAKRGKTSDDMEGLAALYALLQSCIADDEWEAFEDHANAKGADGEALMKVVTDAVTAAAARPTQQPSHSQDGPSTTAASSAAGSSSPGSSIRQGDVRVQADLERRGRPDLGLVVKRARAASTTS